MQGVGFRPWVARQATALGLAGWVKNTGVGVEIALRGTPGALRTFMARLAADAPGRVDSLTTRAAAPSLSSPACVILPSDTGAGGALMGADTAVCATCLDELFDPDNRRFLHPFIHCPACGPRFTLQRDVPFDRVRTSLAPFAECEACVAEGRDPQDRRSHDQTNACPRCGPRLWLRHRHGAEVAHDVAGLDAGAVAGAVAILAAGGVVALKGVGGFHLVALATAADAVARVRAFKARPTKPLALMLPNSASLSPWVDVTADERRHLEDPARPIVLLRQTPHARASIPSVAPSQAWLGVMLPSTPVHHLLFRAAAGASSPSLASTPWVVTSANRRGEPLIVDNADAIALLDDVADGWLLHDREIVARADDSVLRVRSDGSPCLLRRARGLAPLSIVSPPSSSPSSTAAPSVLALGVDEKATVCVARVGAAGRMELVVSPFVGGLSSPASRGVYRGLAHRWRGLAGDDLGAVACDIHPDLFTAGLARELAAAHRLDLVEVGHHHAHVAAVIAEHVAAGDAAPPVIGLALDGHGHGDDGTPWGGEVLYVEGDRCERLGHLWPLALVGGDRAAREPWRLAAAALVELGRSDDVTVRFPGEVHAAAVASLAGRPDAPRTTALGRLFDAAAALLGGPGRTTFEGEAPLWLESRAVDGQSSPSLDPRWHDVAGRQVLDWRPVLAALVDVPRDDVTAVAASARAFHDAMARGLAEGAIAAARARDVDTIVLAGGCLANRFLDEGLAVRLRAAGLKVWQPTQLPCGDAALSAGQAFVALQRRQRRLR